MAEKPILFTAESRVAVRREHNPKIHTRRVIVPQPISTEMCPAYIMQDSNSPSGLSWHSDMYGTTYLKPRYQAGDELWMQEPYQVYAKLNDTMNCLVVQGNCLDDADPFCENLSLPEWLKFNKRKKPYAKTSARYMYKSLTRTWLKVERVWVERAQDISRADVLSEGVEQATIDKFAPFFHKDDCPGLAFRELWDGINKKRGYGWDVNPYTFCYEFEVMDK